MTGIFERIAGLAGTELAKAVNLAHETFQGRMAVHNHTGRALVETAAEVCRNHPNLVGIGAGLLVEQLLVEEKHRHDAHLKAMADAGTPETALTLSGARRDGGKAAKRAQKVRPPKVKVHKIRPWRIAFEVLGGLMLLKIGALGSRLFRRRQDSEIWFAPAARIHMFSAAIAAYNLAAAIRSPKISAWRNGAVAFFGTAALKPVLRVRPSKARASSSPSKAAPPPPADPHPAGDHGTIALTTPWAPEPQAPMTPPPPATAPIAAVVAAPIAAAMVEPAHIEPVHIEPAPVEPSPVEAAHAEPVHAEPVVAEPVPAQPVAAEPAPLEPPWAAFSKVS